MEVIAPGAYRSVCVELQVHHLAVCAIVKSGILNDLEQGALLGFDTGSTVTSRTGGHEAAIAFKTLRTLVDNWLRDATDHHNEYADELLSQIHRWLFSPNSSLRDPSLKNLVELCMKKVFTLLLAELRKLQVEVVYADMRRIIIATGKRDLAQRRRPHRRRFEDGFAPARVILLVATRSHQSMALVALQGSVRLRRHQGVDAARRESVGELAGSERFRRLIRWRWATAKAPWTCTGTSLVSYRKRFKTTSTLSWVSSCCYLGNRKRIKTIRCTVARPQVSGDERQRRFRR